MQINIDIVVTTRGRLSCLQRLLESLDTQTYRHFTVILGDQIGGDVLAPLLAVYADKFAVIHCPIPPGSLSEARNALLPHVMGEIISLADDDCYFAHDAFARLVEYVEETPRTGAFVGAGFHSPVKANLYRKSSKQLSRFTVFYACPSWCVFIKTEVCRKVGNFDVTMGIGAPTRRQSGEETDYLLRILAGGYSVLRCPSVHVFHDSENVEYQNLDKIYCYGIGRMYLIRRHSLPIWFSIANIIYPLMMLLYEYPRLGRPAFLRRWAMFRGRLEGFQALRTGRTEKADNPS
jgi:GT2 family glycosyltransferase